MAQHRLARSIATWQILTPGMRPSDLRIKGNPDTRVTAAETNNIFIYDKIYETLIGSKNVKQILKDQKTLILLM